MAEIRTVVTVLGGDHTGIIAAVATALAEKGANIQDIRQSVLENIFSMTMKVTLYEDKAGFNEVQEALDKVAQDMGVQIQIQREDVFNFMYNI